MENLGLYPKLTKDYILERVSEEEIMEFYMDIPVIDENFYGNSFRNPFRVDDFNTCNYYYDKKFKSPRSQYLNYFDNTEEEL